MKTFRLASFGIRGTVGESLTPEVAIDLAAAFGTFMDDGKILVGRDTRHSSPMFHSAVVSGLLATGCEVLDFGVCPTPMLQFSVEKYGAAGAVSISAGHTRMGINALTLISSNGAFIEPVGGGTVLEIYHARDFRKQPWDKLGDVQLVTDFFASYFDALESHLDAKSIRKAGFTVVIDPVNGAGCRFIEPFAKRFGLKLVPLNADESGYLAHDPEPRPRNAKQVASIIRHVGGDIGFVASTDMGRLSIVTEDAETASEEYTFALIANHVLGKQTGTLVTNCCTTRTVDDIAKSHKATVVKSAVGQAFILSKLADENGVIGGEGSGSVAIPEFSRAFDAFLMMGLILEAMAQSRRKASQLLGELPRYHIVKRQVYGEARRCYRALEALDGYKDWKDGGTLDLTDGTRVDWDDGWIHLRASDTEPMIRIISESKSRQLAEDRAMNAVRVLEQEL
jgi:phosphomannomutase